MKRMVDLIEKLSDDMQTVNVFCYLGDKLIACGCHERTVTTRVRISWVKFKKYESSY